MFLENFFRILIELNWECQLNAHSKKLNLNLFRMKCQILPIFDPNRTGPFFSFVSNFKSHSKDFFSQNIKTDQKLRVKFN